MTLASLNRLIRLARQGPLSSSDDEEPEADDDEWPYEWTETGIETVQGQPVRSYAAEEDPESVFAGPLARQMIEGPREDPDQPLYIGLDTRKGRHVGIERQYLFRHTAVFGTTGYGKSTMMKNSILQIVNSGYGCCVIDPKGQDSIELLSSIPDDRLKDVVWIEPGKTRSAVAGFNFLEVGVDEDHPMYDTAVENVVKDLVKMIGLDDYWGPLMDGVCSNLIRGTTRLDYDFNLLDLYYILISEEARAQYASMLDDAGLNFLADYAHKIEEMEDDDLDALQRRFKDWVEDPLARDVVAHRDTDIDIESIVEDRKILIVRMAEQSEDLKAMVGTALLRRLWSTVRARSVAYDTDHDPYFLFCDEFDLLATQDSAVPTMLSKARSLGLALFLCCQNPSQLPDEIVSAMYANCDTVLSFSPGDPDDSRAVAKNLDMDPQTLRNESNYHVWMQLTISATRERSEAFRTYCLPPYPPVRDIPETMHAIEWSARKYGRDPLTDAELRQDLILGDGVPDPSVLTVEGDDESGGSGGRDIPVEPVVVKAIYDECVVRDRVDEGVTVDEVRDRINRYLPDRDVTVDSQVWGFVDNISEDNLEERKDDDEVYLRPTNEGVTDIFATGGGPTAGVYDHRQLLKDAYEPLLRLGLEVELPKQFGQEEVDGIGRLRETWDPEIDLDELSDGARFRTAQKMLETFREENPLLARLTGGGDVTLEAESTTSTKPSQTILNLKKAHERGQRCLFLAREEEAKTVWDALANPPLAKWHEGDRTAFYNRSNKLRIGEQEMLRPGAPHTTWVYDEAADEYLMEDGDGEVHATFSDYRAIWSDTSAYTAAEESEADPSSDEWHYVYPPLLPESEFVGDSPTEEDWDVIVVPEDIDEDGDPAEELGIIVDGEVRPLSAVVDGKTDDEGSDEEVEEDEEPQSSGPDLSDLRARLD